MNTLVSMQSPYTHRDDNDTSLDDQITDQSSEDEEGDIHPITADDTTNQYARVGTNSDEQSEDQISPDDEKSDGHPIDIVTDWNEKFLELAHTLADDVKKLAEMAALADNFLYAAVTSCKTIVAELHINDTHKIIKKSPRYGNNMFEVHGLLCKFPSDIKINNDTWLFGGHSQSDVIAAKVSNHYFTGTNRVMQVDLNDINYPILVLLDYQGFRMIVQVNFPIREDTIIYGSIDGKEIVFDENIHEKLKTISQRLNLRPHIVEKNIEMALCASIKIHKTTEDEYYAVDLERVFPPAAYLASAPPGVTLFRQLRPE